MFPESRDSMQRLIKIILPQQQRREALGILEEREGIRFWQEEAADGQAVISVLTDIGNSESIMDLIERRFSANKDFTLVLLPVQASLPRMKNEGKDTRQTGIPPDKKEPKLHRISREEMYTELVGNAKSDGTFLLMVALSTIVAGIGLLKNSGPLIIGAMVLAPFLGPNVAAALSSTLADGKLGRSAGKTLFIGVLISLGMSVTMGVLFHPDPLNYEIVSRTKVGIPDIIVALAAGCAGVLAFTTGISSALIGVMVAVALLPPIVTAGLLLGADLPTMALRAFVLFATNIICINLAGVLTFVLKGIGPRTFWEKEKARKSYHIAVLIWSVTLLGLIILLTILESMGWTKF